jgi:hypothetical protein
MKILHQDEPVTLQDDAPARLQESAQAAKIKDGTVKVSLLDNGESGSHDHCAH